MIAIKFRGKSKDNNQWVYGFYVKSRNRHYILQEYNDSGYDERWETSDWIEVDERTVGQFTGDFPDHWETSHDFWLDLYK